MNKPAGKKHSRVENTEHYNAYVVQTNTSHIFQCCTTDEEM